MSALDHPHRDLAWVTRDSPKGFLNDDREESGTVGTTHSSSTVPHSNISEFAVATSRQKEHALLQIRAFLRSHPVHHLCVLITHNVLITVVRRELPVDDGIVTDEEITQEAETFG